MCIDGDALLDRDAAAYVWNRCCTTRVGAVTGNPRIRTRSTLVGKKFRLASIPQLWFDQADPAYLWKRIYRFRCYCRISSQRPGEVGYWSDDMITEDIDISWKLQLNQWTIFYDHGRCTGY